MKQVQRVGFWLMPLMIVALADPALARAWRRGSYYGGSGCGGCASNCAQNCQVVYRTVERTINVPTMVTENRTIKVTECRAEQRTSTYTVNKPVMETQTVQSEIVVPSYETRTRTINYTVCKPVMSTQERQYTVMVPQQEKRQGTRQVCRMVAVQQTRTVCEDQGSWQQVQQTYTVGCGDCAQTCVRCCNVWVPKVVTREVPYTVMRPQMEQVPYEYTVTTCRAETRTQQVQVCNYVNEQQSRQVQYTVCVPKRQTVSRQVQVCRMVAEQRQRNYTVQVPYQVEKQIQVQVCRYVPKTIQCQVAETVYTPCNNGCNTPCNSCN